MATKTAVQRLQKQMVCRRPTAEDLRDRTPIVVTERDQELLVDVYRHGFLTTDLIELAYFPPDARRRSRSSCCYDRLKLLWLWNYVDRIELPIARVLGGRRPYLYTLGRRGLPYVQARVGADVGPVQLRRLDRLHDLFIEHDLRAASLWACLKAVVRATRLRCVEWTSERELRARRFRVQDPDNGRWLPVLPDGLLELVYPDETAQAALVEVDMGTVDLKRFRRKVRAIERFFQVDGFDRYLDLERVEVWVLAKSAERIEHLRHAAWPEVPEQRRADYLFATFDEVTPRHLAGSTLLYLDGQRRPALHSDAFGKPGAAGGA